MVEVIVRAEQFKKSIRLVLSGRSEYMEKDTADFIARTDDLELCSTGSSTHLSATVVQAGAARVPLPVLKSVKRVAASFKQDRLRIKIETGRFKVETFSFSHDQIELKTLGDRIADVPIDAPALDVLALQKLYSADELVESGLTARVLEAQEKAVAAINWVADSLKPFGVPREAVRDLVDAHVALHAKALKAIVARL